jgi:hypothetical protein
LEIVVTNIGQCERGRTPYRFGSVWRGPPASYLVILFSDLIRKLTRDTKGDLSQTEKQLGIDWKFQSELMVLLESDPRGHHCVEPHNQLHKQSVLIIMLIIAVSTESTKSNLMFLDLYFSIWGTQ